MKAARPGAQANPHYLFGLPLFAVFAHCLVGAALGAAEGALDQIVDSVRDKTTVANVKLAAQPTIQTRIAEAAAEIAAARALLQVDRARINDLGRLRLLPDDETRVRYRLNVGYAGQAAACRRSSGCCRSSAAAAWSCADPFQRAWRDAHAVAQHIALTWDLQALNYGAVRLGGKAGDPRI